MIKKFLSYLFIKKPLNRVYAHATTWQLIKYRLFYVGARYALIVSLLVSSLYASGAIGSRFFPQIVYANTHTLDSSLNEKAEQLKTQLIDDIASCESAGLKASDAPIIFDTNNKASIGVLQFQKATVIYYEHSLNNRTLSPLDATLIALDPLQAKALARQIVFTTDTHKALSNWLNCANKLGLVARVEFIKSLTK